MKRSTIGFAVFVAGFVSATAIYARQTAKPGARSVVNFAADQMRSVPLPGGKESLSTLESNVVIESKEATLTTGKATYNGDTQIATAPTRLKLDDKQNTLTADKGVAYYSTRDADFAGNVVINARPKPGGGANAAPGSLRRNFKDPVTITCSRVRYNWRTKKAILTGNLTIKQRDRTITGTQGLYDGVAETVTLFGNIKSRRPTGEKGDAPGANARAVACFTEGGEYVEITRDPGLKTGKVRAEIPVREKANGEVEVVESVDVAPVEPPVPSPTPDTGTAPEP